MMTTVPYFKFKDKVSLSLIIVLLFASIYFYLNHLQQTYNSVQWSGDRCVAELTSIKYQLNVVTEYKNRIDRLLTESQKIHETEKQRFNDIMDSCVVMKQQTAICQNQFEDLQTECKKVREDYSKVLKELEKLKSTG